MYFNFSASPEREILWASEQGNLDLVKSLVLKNSKLVHVHDKDGYTALHRASYSNHLSIVQVSVFDKFIYTTDIYFTCIYVYSFYSKIMQIQMLEQLINGRHCIQLVNGIMWNVQNN